MCELLINIYDNSNPDPVKDRQGCWKRGYVICVQDDGWQWTETEKNGYKILKLPKVPRADVEAKLLEQEEEYVAGEGLTLYRRRRYKFDFTKLTAAAEAQLADEGRPKATRIVALNAALIDQAAA